MSREFIKIDGLKYTPDGNKRICHKNDCLQSSLVKFEKTKENGEPHSYCNKCFEYSKKNDRGELDIDSLNFNTPDVYVYRIYNTITGETVYVGSTKGGRRRMYNHLGGTDTNAKVFYRRGDFYFWPKEYMMSVLTGDQSTSLFWFDCEECDEAILSNKETEWKDIYQPSWCAKTLNGNWK